MYHIGHVASAARARAQIFTRLTKTKAKKINNQASFGSSILKANMEVEAAIELAHGLDETGIT